MSCSPYLPAGLDDFAEKVVPELQRRVALPSRVRGQDLAENLAERPPNRFFEGAEATIRKAG